MREPQILNFGRAGSGMKLREGMGLHRRAHAEPGSRKVSTAKDGWTVVTSDGKLSAQFEHTVAVTRSGVDVLTLRRDERPSSSFVA
jgi:methionyl aminopeptidase